MRPEDADPELARLLAALRPDELALLGWVRTRIDASMVDDIAVLDYGMHVEEYRDSIGDVLAVRRLPEQLPWMPGAVLQPASSHEPAADDLRGHAARLFSCLVLVCTDDVVLEDPQRVADHVRHRVEPRLARRRQRRPLESRHGDQGSGGAARGPPPPPPGAGKTAPRAPPRRVHVIRRQLRARIAGVMPAPLVNDGHRDISDSRRSRPRRGATRR